MKGESFGHAGLLVNYHKLFIANFDINQSW